MKDLSHLVFLTLSGAIVGGILLWTHVRASEALTLATSTAASQQVFIKDFNEKVVPQILRELDAAKAAAGASKVAKK